MPDEPVDSPLAPQEADALRALRRPEVPGAGSSRALRETIRRRGGFSGTKPWWTVAALAATLVIGFVAGRNMEPPGAQEASGPQYAVVLLNTPPPTWPSGTSEEQIVAAYRDWSVRLAREGRLSVAEELDTARLLIDSTGTRAGTTADGIGGLFIVTAADDAAAAAIAATLPHVRQGGVVAVQRITTR